MNTLEFEGIIRNILESKEIIGMILSAIIGVSVAFILSYSQNYYKEKRELELWKIIVYQELVKCRRKVEGYKRLIESPKGQEFMTEGMLILNEKIYDYNSASKILGKDFDIYLKNIEKFKFIDLEIKKYLEGKLHGQKGELSKIITDFEFEGINLEELDLIIDKISQGLDKKIRLKLEK